MFEDSFSSKKKNLYGHVIKCRQYLILIWHTSSRCNSQHNCEAFVQAVVLQLALAYRDESIIKGEGMGRFFYRPREKAA